MCVGDRQIARESESIGDGKGGRLGGRKVVEEVMMMGPLCLLVRIALSKKKMKTSLHDHVSLESGFSPLLIDIWKKEKRKCYSVDNGQSISSR